MFFMQPENSKIQAKPIDQKKLQDIYDLYYSDPYIQICREYKYSHVFRGKLEVSHDVRGVEVMTSDALHSLTGMLKIAEDYRTMFGFCALKVIRSSSNEKIGVIVLDHDSGQFIRVFDTMTSQARLIFQPFYKSDGTPNQHADLDPDVHVFTWDNRLPSKNGRIKSPIFTLFRRSNYMDELYENAMMSDYNTANPSLFTQKKAEHGQLEDMTEEEVFGQFRPSSAPGVNDDGTPLEKQTYRRDVMRAIHLEEKARITNTTKKLETNRKMVNEDKVVLGRRHRFYEPEGAVKALGEGEEIARQVISTSRSDILDWESSYIEVVCNIMGVPNISSLARQTKVTSAADQVKEVLHSTVATSREELNNFFKAVYSFLKKDDDDKMIERIADILKHNASHLSDVYGEGIIDNANMVLSTIQKKESLVELIFNDETRRKEENPDMQHVLTAYGMGIISDQEITDMIRSRFGLPLGFKKRAFVKTPEGGILFSSAKPVKDNN